MTDFFHSIFVMINSKVSMKTFMPNKFLARSTAVSFILFSIDSSFASRISLSCEPHTLGHAGNKKPVYSCTIVSNVAPLLHAMTKQLRKADSKGKVSQYSNSFVYRRIRLFFNNSYFYTSLIFDKNIKLFDILRSLAKTFSSSILLIYEVLSKSW